ncbi:TspO/MBR family protein [Sphingomonas baiyangensis]|uniref:Tryptophan-rich sensory protein n=1 Tax=Sphingomonas baiyangensis TaxID=2572576 RepID=A0A4U1L2T5_9SPHN|nr:TspO/MBR family protein [Sphingomonas baiyangensis]TKD51207.1 tryptophan-rich sensory protein [Sphingomonas baiyangensis]
MREIASRSQLRWSFLRYAIVTVPLVVLLGSFAGRLAPTGADNGWYMMLAKPSWEPPGWAFGVAWTLLYALMGLALAMILHARSARWRGLAVTLFVVQLIANLAWSPLFFGLRMVSFAPIHIAIIFVLALATTFAFARVRPLAAWLLVPYLAWLCFAGLLAWEIDRLNPDGETLVPTGASTQIEL